MPGSGSPGVIATRVGYAGGTKKDPTYRSMGDHSETVQIDYDPDAITYGGLLAEFWGEPSPHAAGGIATVRVDHLLCG